MRTVVLYLTSSQSAEVICQASRKWRDRFTWLVVTRDREEFSKGLSDGCDKIDSRVSIVLFEVATRNTDELKVRVHPSNNLYNSLRGVSVPI